MCKKFWRNNIDGATKSVFKLCKCIFWSLLKNERNSNTMAYNWFSSNELEEKTEFYLKSLSGTDRWQWNCLCCVSKTKRSLFFFVQGQALPSISGLMQASYLVSKNLDGLNCELSKNTDLTVSLWKPNEITQFSTCHRAIT